MCTGGTLGMSVSDPWDQISTKENGKNVPHPPVTPNLTPSLFEPFEAVGCWTSTPYRLNTAEPLLSH